MISVALAQGSIIFCIGYSGQASAFKDNQLHSIFLQKISLSSLWAVPDMHRPWKRSKRNYSACKKFTLRLCRTLLSESHWVAIIKAITHTALTYFSSKPFFHFLRYVLLCHNKDFNVCCCPHCLLCMPRKLPEHLCRGQDNLRPPVTVKSCVSTPSNFRCCRLWISRSYWTRPAEQKTICDHDDNASADWSLTCNRPAPNHRHTQSAARATKSEWTCVLHTAGLGYVPAHPPPCWKWLYVNSCLKVFTCTEFAVLLSSTSL